jgi:hypothetical protein
VSVSAKWLPDDHFAVAEPVSTVLAGHCLTSLTLISTL